MVAAVKFNFESSVLHLRVGYCSTIFPHKLSTDTSKSNSLLRGR